MPNLTSCVRRRSTFYATDKFQNVGTKTVTVTVNDCSPPSIVCPDISTTTKPGVCYCTVGSTGDASWEGNPLASNQGVYATDNSG